MSTFNITGSITTNAPISASYIAGENVDGNVATASYALTVGTIGGINGMAYFTASGIWTVPSGIQNVRVICIGAGGGGAAGSTGGGGGGYSEGVVSVEGFSTLPVTVGSGGSPGNNGTDSGFLYITGSGGFAGGNGNGGSGYSGSINIKGQNGDTVIGGASGNLPWIPFIASSIIAALENNLGYGFTTFGSVGCGGYGNASVGPTSNGYNGVVIIYY